MSLANETSIPETWFPELLGLPFGPGRHRHHGDERLLRRASPRASSSRRKPPDTEARITSLTVAPKTAFTSLTSSSGTDKVA